MFAEKESIRDFQGNLVHFENSTQILNLLYQNVIFLNNLSRYLFSFDFRFFFQKSFLSMMRTISEMKYRD